MLWFVIAGLISFAIVAAILRMQASATDEEEARRKVQRARRVGLAPIPGADGEPARKEGPKGGDGSNAA